MGNSEETNRHTEAMQRINNQDSSDRRKYELQRYIEQNNLQKYIKEIERKAKVDLYQHEENMENLSIKREEMQNKYANERENNQYRHEEEKNRIENNHSDRKSVV